MINKQRSLFLILCLFFVYLWIIHFHSHFKQINFCKWSLFDGLTAVFLFVFVFFVFFNLRKIFRCMRIILVDFWPPCFIAGSTELMARKKMKNVFWKWRWTIERNWFIGCLGFQYSLTVPCDEKFEIRIHRDDNDCKGVAYCKGDKCWGVKNR